MIGFIRGTIIKSFLDGKRNVSLIVWPLANLSIPGVGYRILISQQTALLHTDNKLIELWIYNHQSDNESLLLGLDSIDKMDFFLRLLSVSGVGPKTALHIVDTVTLSEMNDALVKKDITLFAKIPGIGKKTAGKIILELSGELAPELHPVQIKKENDELVSALRSLGYKDSEAREVVLKAKPDLEKLPATSTFEEKIRVLFRYL